MREEIAEVDRNYFYEWAKEFVEHVKNLTAKNQNFLRKYDEYRCHMSIMALKLFKRERNYSLCVTSAQVWQITDTGGFIV